MKLLPFVLVFLLCATFVLGEEEVSRIRFLDAGTTVQNAIVHFSLVNEEEHSFDAVLFMQGDALELEQVEGAYRGTIVLDDPSTDAADYAFSGEVTFARGDVTLTVFPIAFLRGEVYDQSHTLVSRALLDFTCDTPTSLLFPPRTDKYGSFTSYVSVGRCVVGASTSAFRGKKELATTRGQSLATEIVLDTKVGAQTFLVWIVGILVVAGLVVLALKNYVRVPRLRQKRKEHPQLMSVRKTLNATEQQILDFLALHRETTSAALRHALKIPRTSLSRILERLAVKQIVELERHGKMKRVKLASWIGKK